MFKFITHRSFAVNLLAIIVLSAAVIFGFLQLLGLITRHGEYLTVPSVLGKPTTEAISMLENRGFEVVIQDSVFVDTTARGTVLKQLPDPNSTVKVNRSVYLTVNRVTLPMIDMPQLEGKTLSFALEVLKRSHLQLGDTLYKPDFMRGSVLEQSFRGSRIPPGAKVPWGSSIDLLIGKGLDIEKIPVPNLLGLTLTEARLLLEMNNIELGAIVPDQDVRDTAAAFVYRQEPPPRNADGEQIFIQSGQLMDIWISKEMKTVKDTLKW